MIRSGRTPLVVVGDDPWRGHGGHLLLAHPGAAALPEAPAPVTLTRRFDADGLAATWTALEAAWTWSQGWFLLVRLDPRAPAIDARTFAGESPLWTVDPPRPLAAPLVLARDRDRLVTVDGALPTRLGDVPAAARAGALVGEATFALFWHIHM